MITRLLLLTGLTVVPFPGNVAPIEAIPVQGGCPNAIQYEPVLMYEVHGGTLTGPCDCHLVLYSDGTARLSDISNLAAPKVAIRYPGVEAISALCLRVERYGGLLNRDAEVRVMDVPLRTVTLLKGATDARAHTWSWWLPEGPNAAIEREIDRFLAEHFPRY